MADVLTFGSVCDGIGCGHLGFEQAGFKCAWSAEIEAFPSAVLDYRFPGVPNLGDITADDFIERAQQCGHIDALIGGTPCQAFSVAGKREGVSDPRGALTFRFIEIAERLKPEFVMWENVPGILSTDDGKCFEFFLDELLRLGYITNCDVLDSQFFGVAQRRRRVFVSCQLASILMQQKTHISAITLAQTIGELSRDILNAHQVASGNAPVFSDVLCVNVSDGLQRKMKPFEQAGEEVFRIWLQNSEEVFRRVQQDAACLVSKAGLGTKTEVDSRLQEEDTPSQASSVRRVLQHTLCSNTDSSLKKCWEGVFDEARLCITSTPSKPTTDEKIWQLFKAVTLTAECILLLKDSYQNFSTVGSSFLTTLKEFISYARRTDEPIFTEPRVYRLRCDILQQAELAAKSLADTRIECWGQVFSISEGVRRDTAPSREAGQGVAGDVGSGVATGSLCARTGRSISVQDAAQGHLIGVSTFDRQSTGEYGTAPVASTVAARDYKSASDLIATYDMRGNGDGETVGTLCTDHASRPSDFCPVVAFSHCDNRRDADVNVAPVMRSRGGQRSDGTCGDAGNGNVAVAFQPRFFTRDNKTGGAQSCGEIIPALSAQHSGEDSAPHVVTRMQVRRLTPVECERLQGLPDNWTRIPWRGKPAEDCPDGPRYKGIGNGQTVQVMRWLADRIVRGLQHG